MLDTGPTEALDAGVEQDQLVQDVDDESRLPSLRFGSSPSSFQPSPSTLQPSTHPAQLSPCSSHPSPPLLRSSPSPPRSSSQDLLQTQERNTEQQQRSQQITHGSEVWSVAQLLQRSTTHMHLCFAVAFTRHPLTVAYSQLCSGDSDNDSDHDIFQCVPRRELIATRRRRNAESAGNAKKKITSGQRGENENDSVLAQHMARTSLNQDKSVTMHLGESIIAVLPEARHSPYQNSSTNTSPETHQLSTTPTCPL